MTATRNNPKESYIRRDVPPRIWKPLEIVRKIAEKAYGDEPDANLSDPMLILWEMMSEQATLLNVLCDYLNEEFYGDWILDAGVLDKDNNLVGVNPEYVPHESDRIAMDEILTIMEEARDLAIQADRKLDEAYPILMKAMGIPEHHTSILNNEMLRERGPLHVLPYLGLRMEEAYKATEAKLASR